MPSWASLVPMPLGLNSASLKRLNISLSLKQKNNKLRLKRTRKLSKLPNSLLKLIVNLASLDKQWVTMWITAQPSSDRPLHNHRLWLKPASTKQSRYRNTKISLLRPSQKLWPNSVKQSRYPNTRISLLRPSQKLWPNSVKQSRYPNTRISLLRPSQKLWPNSIS